MNLEGRDRDDIGAIRLTPQALGTLVRLVQDGRDPSRRGAQAARHAL
jgi:hypothetical protein